MHWCYSKYVCVSLEWHCSWPSRIDRNYIYYFPESWFNIIVQNHFAWNMVLFILFFRLFILCKLSCQSNSLFVWNDRVESSLLRFCAVEPATIFPLHHMKHLLRMTTSVCNEGTFTWSQANVEQRNLNRSCSKDERKEKRAYLLPLNFLYTEILSRLMHDVRNASAPPKICNLFTKTSTIHSYNSRSSASNNFYIKRSRLEVQKMLFRK